MTLQKLPASMNLSPTYIPKWTKSARPNQNERFETNSTPLSPHRGANCGLKSEHKAQSVTTSAKPVNFVIISPTSLNMEIKERRGQKLREALFVSNFNIPKPEQMSPNKA